MARRFFGIALIVVSLTSFPPHTARAQFAGLEAAMMAGASGSRVVTGTGSVVVRRQPTKLRMIIELRGKVKTLEEALGALKDRREAAVVQLEALEADKETINFSVHAVFAVKE